MVTEALPLLLSEGLTEALDQLVQLLRVVAQELLDVLQTLQGGGGPGARLRQTRVHLDGPGDAEDAVALLPLVVEGLVKQDGDRSQSGKPGPQEDLSVLDLDCLRQKDRVSAWLCTWTGPGWSGSSGGGGMRGTAGQTFPSSVWKPSSTGCRT